MDAFDDPELALISEDEPCELDDRGNHDSSLVSSVLCDKEVAEVINDCEVVEVPSKRRRQRPRGTGFVDHPLFNRVREQTAAAARNPRAMGKKAGDMSQKQSDAWQSCKWATVHYGVNLRENYSGNAAQVTLPTRRSRSTNYDSIRDPVLIPMFESKLECLRAASHHADAPLPMRPEESSELMVDRAKPSNLSELVTADHETKKQFLSWLREWRVSSPTCIQVSRFSLTDSEDWADSEDSNLGVSSFNPPVALVCGPVGCGKTSLVFSAAASAGYTVHEVNASLYATSSKNFVHDLIERTQSHRIGAKRDQSALNRNQLLLVDDVDQAMENRGAFWNAVANLNACSKIPIVLVCNDQISVYDELRRRQVDVRLISLAKLENTDVLEALGSAFGPSVDPCILLMIARQTRGDLRLAINTAQFWTHGESNGARGPGLVEQIWMGNTDLPMEQLPFDSEEILVHWKKHVMRSHAPCGHENASLTVAVVSDAETRQEHTDTGIYPRVAKWSRLFGRLSDASILDDSGVGGGSEMGMHAFWESSWLERRAYETRIPDERPLFERITKIYDWVEALVPQGCREEGIHRALEPLLAIQVSTRLLRVYHVPWLMAMAREHGKRPAEPDERVRRSRRLGGGDVSNFSSCAIYTVNADSLRELNLMRLPLNLK